MLLGPKICSTAYLAPGSADMPESKNWKPWPYDLYGRVLLIIGFVKERYSKYLFLGFKDSMENYQHYLLFFQMYVKK